MRRLIKQLIPIKFRVRGYIDWLRDEGVVLSGCFAGMKCIPAVVGSVNRPKIMGTYEKELSPISCALPDKYKTVIDVGAAEGYYAVGLAIKYPSIQKIVAFEMQPEGQHLIQENAKLNQVESKIVVNGKCTPQILNDTADASCFLVMDVEGFEKELLNPELCPILLHMDILVEIHDFISTEIAELIKERFHQTHFIHEIKETERTFQDFPLRFSLLQTSIFHLSFQDYKAAALHAMNEKRPMPMRWFYMTRKADISNAV